MKQYVKILARKRSEGFQYVMAKFPKSHRGKTERRRIIGFADKGNCQGQQLRQNSR